MSKLTAAKVSSRLQPIAQKVDRVLEQEFDERVGFILLVWVGNEVSYVGTDHDRANTIKAMRELIEKWESGAPATPAHLRQ